MLTFNAVFASHTTSTSATATATATAVRLLLDDKDRQHIPIPGSVLPFALLSLPDQRYCSCLHLALRLGSGLGLGLGPADHDECANVAAHDNKQQLLVLMSAGELTGRADQVQGQVKVALIPLSPVAPKPAPSLHYRLDSSVHVPTTSWLSTALHGYPVHPHSSPANPTRLRAQLGTRSFSVDVWPSTPPPPLSNVAFVIAAHATQFTPAPSTINVFQDATQLSAAIQDVGGVRGQQELVQRVASWLMRQLTVLQGPQGDDGMRSRFRVEHALISGSSGSGKSLLANAIAATTGLGAIHLSCTSAPTDLLPLTTYLSRSASSPAAPTLVIIDHIDSLSPTQSDLLAHLLDTTPPCHMLVLALTSHSLPSPLTRRFSAHFPLHPPRTSSARLAILSSMLPTLPPLTSAISSAIHHAHGLSPGDLARAAGLATTHALASNTSVANHLPEALARVKPMAVAELVMDIPMVDLARDVYALDAAVRDIQVAVLDPFTRMLAGSGGDDNTGNELARGMLIHGPPGVGKSLVAMGVVHRLGFTCVPLDASRVLSKVVGASEAAIARAFAAARAAAPCVLLLDQVETLAGHRGAGSMGQEGTGDRIVTCLLTELDGILAKGNAGGGVFVIAMSSNIAQIDSALLRPGRLDVHIHLAQPNTLEQAKQLVDGFASRHPHALSQHELDKHVAKRCVGMTGAQVKGVWERAAVRAIREDKIEIGLEHLVGVLEDVDV